MTISLCMIVKNEEKTLPVCLSSLQGIVDEMIIVDTGSTDSTKDVARSFGARVCDYVWQDDFAAARNHAFSLATGDYIYSADADEEIDAENRERFLALKEDLACGRIEADIVQFLYGGQLNQRSVYNYDCEYRPKLFKRQRSFVWEGAVHEQVRLDAAVYDSGIRIEHKPHGQHAARDLAIFARMTERGEKMPERMEKLYARELWIAGTEDDLRRAEGFFSLYAEETQDAAALEAALLICLRAARAAGDTESFFKYAIRLIDGQEKSSELCMELGEHYLTAGDPGEALLWFLSARAAAAPVLDLEAGTRLAAKRAAECFRLLGDADSAQEYEDLAAGEKEEADGAQG